MKSITLFLALAGVVFHAHAVQSDSSAIEETRNRRLRAELKAAKTPEEVREEAGDLLMAVVWLCHKLGAESELVLSEACEKFIVRFAAMEQEACKQGISLGDLDENGWLRLWRQAKITN